MSRSGHDSAEVFQCPTNVPLGIFSKHAHPEDCRLYFVCIAGIAREYGCPHGTVFSVGADEFTGKCSDPKEVAECSQYYGNQIFDAEEMAKSGLDMGKSGDDSTGSGSFTYETRSHASGGKRLPRHNNHGLGEKELAELHVEINRDFSNIKRESPKFTPVNQFHQPRPNYKTTTRRPTPRKQQTTKLQYLPKLTTRSRPNHSVAVPPPTSVPAVPRQHQKEYVAQQKKSSYRPKKKPTVYTPRPKEPVYVPAQRKEGIPVILPQPQPFVPKEAKPQPIGPIFKPHTPPATSVPQTPKSSSVLFQASPKPTLTFPIPPIPTSTPVITTVTSATSAANEATDVVKVKGPGDEFYYYYYYDDEDDSETTRSDLDIVSVTSEN